MALDSSCGIALVFAEPSSIDGSSLIKSLDPTFMSIVKLNKNEAIEEREIELMSKYSKFDITIQACRRAQRKSKYPFANRRYTMYIKSIYRKTSLKW